MRPPAGRKLKTEFVNNNCGGKGTTSFNNNNGGSSFQNNNGCGPATPSTPAPASPSPPTGALCLAAAQGKAVGTFLIACTQIHYTVKSPAGLYTLLPVRCIEPCEWPGLGLGVSNHMGTSHLCVVKSRFVASCSVHGLLALLVRLLVSLTCQPPGEGSHCH